MEKSTRTLVRNLVQSKYLDVFAALLIFGICIWRNFHGTIFFNGEIQFGISMSELVSYMQQGAFPLGIVSMIGAIFSVLATRLVGKQNNWGNFIGIFTTITSGVIDYLFGNHSAIITYPVTFFIQTYAYSKWKNGERIRKRDVFYYLILAGGMLLGFALVYLGAYLFGGITDPTFLILVSVIFGLSVGGNVCNAFKYEETWLSWVIYNIVNLGKNAMQANLANVVKYVFYLFNAAVTLLDWKWNGDADKNISDDTNLIDQKVIPS
ncbi:MAG: nicotinamide mononucleotide transporter family protein [Saprospiraceae bacterium]